jgi:hypothetical protein
MGTFYTYNGKEHTMKEVTKDALNPAHVYILCTATKK